MTFFIALCCTFSFIQCAGTKNKTETEKTYIILFKTNQTSTKPTSKRPTKNNTNEFEQQINQIIKQANISPSKIGYYYSAINGISIQLTEKQAEKMEQNPNVLSIEADQEIKVDLPKPEGKK